MQFCCRQDNTDTSNCVTVLEKRNLKKIVEVFFPVERWWHLQVSWCLWQVDKWNRRKIPCEFCTIYERAELCWWPAVWFWGSVTIFWVSLPFNLSSVSSVCTPGSPRERLMLDFNSAYSGGGKGFLVWLKLQDANLIWNDTNDGKW